MGAKPGYARLICFRPDLRHASGTPSRSIEVRRRGLFSEDVTAGAPELTIRRARPGEAESLTALALRSKAHWGYDAEFLETVRELLTFTERDLADELVYVLDAGREHVGVYRLTGDPPEGELSDLWLDPRFIGRELGRRLFRHAIDTARAHGYRTLVIESDPNAEGFYAAMGAARIGERLSPSGRTLPLMLIPT
jgi:GNAT superfamily N-acetyltransferase